WELFTPCLRGHSFLAWSSPPGKRDTSLSEPFIRFGVSSIGTLAQGISQSQSTGIIVGPPRSIPPLHQVCLRFQLASIWSSAQPGGVVRDLDHGARTLLPPELSSNRAPQRISNADARIISLPTNQPRKASISAACNSRRKPQIRTSGLRIL